VLAACQAFFVLVAKRTTDLPIGAALRIIWRGGTGARASSTVGISNLGAAAPLA
jgi:hypothetical protein